MSSAMFAVEYESDSINRLSVLGNIILYLPSGMYLLHDFNLIRNHMKITSNALLA